MKGRVRGAPPRYIVSVCIDWSGIDVVCGEIYDGGGALGPVDSFLHLHTGWRRFVRCVWFDNMDLRRVVC